MPADHTIPPPNAQNRLLWSVVPSHLVSIEGPGAELHLTVLLVEGEVFDVDTARRLVDGRGDPQHLPGIVDHNVRLVRHLVLAISTASKEF